MDLTRSIVDSTMSDQYGKINRVVQIDEDARWRAMYEWTKTWTSMPQGSYHFPKVRGGADVALFSLAPGRMTTTKVRMILSLRYRPSLVTSGRRTWNIRSSHDMNVFIDIT